jgi:hypothetical protein
VNASANAGIQMTRRAFVGAVGVLVTHGAFSRVASAETPVAPPTGSDAERVTARFMAAAKLSPPHTALLQPFTRALHDAGVYGKLVAAYPFVGADLASAALNLVDPADEDGAFRLTFSGEPKVEAKGLAWSAGSKADTHVDYALITGTPRVGAAYFVHSAFDGAVMSNGEPGFTLVQRDAGTGKAYLQIAASADGIAYPGDRRAGFWAMQRGGANATGLELYHDGAPLGVETRAVNSVQMNRPIVLNPQGVTHVMSYAAIARELTAREQSAHHAAVHALLKGLGRLV